MFVARFGVALVLSVMRALRPDRNLLPSVLIRGTFTATQPLRET
jgi:hypothetical protein